MVAAQEGHCEVVMLLLKAGADVNMKKNNVSHAAWWCLCTQLDSHVILYNEWVCDE